MDYPNLEFTHVMERGEKKTGINIMEIETGMITS